MIKFHYHTARTSVPRLNIEKGDRLCHTYSDTSLEELVAWGAAHGLPEEWIDRDHVLPHYDLHGDQLRHAGPGVDRRELVADIRAWRARQES